MATLAPERIARLLDLREKISASKRFILAWLAVVWFDTVSSHPSLACSPFLNS
jgi:hypothetical protein